MQVLLPHTMPHNAGPGILALLITHDSSHVKVSASARQPDLPLHVAREMQWHFSFVFERVHPSSAPSLISSLVPFAISVV